MPFFVKANESKSSVTVKRPALKARQKDDLFKTKPKKQRRADTAKEMRQKLLENDDVPSEDEEIEQEAGEGGSDESEHEYEDTHETSYRQAKQLLSNIYEETEQLAIEDEDEEDRLVKRKLRDSAKEKAGTLGKELADSLYIDDENEIVHRAHRFTPVAVAISPCSRYVISAGKESHIIKYDVEHKKVVGIIKRTKGDDRSKAHFGHIFALAVSPDGKYIASGGYDCTVKIWEFATLKHVRDLKGHRMPITCLRFRMGSSHLFSASRDRTVRMYDTDQMGLVDTMHGHMDAVLSIDSLRKERCLACGSQDRSIRLWKVEEESQLVFNGATDCVSIDCVAMITETSYVSGSADGSVSLWGVIKKKPLFIIHAAHGYRDALRKDPRWIVSVAAGPFTDLVASGSDDGSIRVWKAANNFSRLNPIYEYSAPGFVNDMRFSLDASLLVCAIGKEHKYGRWWVHEEAENQVVILPLNYDGQVDEEESEESDEESDEQTDLSE